MILDFYHSEGARDRIENVLATIFYLQLNTVGVTQANYRKQYLI